MEKRRNNGPLDACEKFFKAITASSPFRAIRRVSYHHRDSMSAASPAPSPSPIVNTRDSEENTKPVESAHRHKTPKNGEAAEVVPIKFDYSDQLPSVAPREEPLSQLARVKKVATRHRPTELAQKYNHRPDNTPPTHEVGYGSQGAQVPRMQSNKLGTNAEDEFTAFINRAGAKIRTTSSVGGKKNSSSASGEDDSKDHFSDYINRAKHKMLRTMSSFVGGRSGSMK